MASKRTRWVVGIIFILFAGYLSLAYRGFCFSNWHFLSDAEAQRAAIASLLELPPTGAKLSSARASTFVVAEPLIFQSVDDFSRQNPDCCKVVPVTTPTDQWGPLDFFDRALGRAAKVIGVKYPVRYSDEAGGKKLTAAERWVIVGNCGEIFPFR
jgi:hypothetical protein